MSFVDLFGTVKSCPNCQQPGAKVFLSWVKCQNPACAHFDMAYRNSQMGARQGASVDSAKSTFKNSGPSKADRTTPPVAPTVAQGEVAILYRNFKNEQKYFIADVGQLEWRRHHLKAVVRPKHKPIYLNRDRILNLSEFESRIPEA